MRVRVKLTYWKCENKKGFKGYWHMNYYVTNVVNKETGEVITDSYVFKKSALFKGKKFKDGDVGEVTVTVENIGTDDLKLLRPFNLVKI